MRSRNAAETHLRALENKAMIGIERGAARGITLLPLAADELPAAANLPLPLVGRVAAGRPVLAHENIEDEYRLDPTLFSHKPHYPLRVQGISMQDAGILDGVLLAVHRTPEARNGQIVVAHVDERGDSQGRKCFSGTHIPDMSTLLRYCAHNPSVRIFRTDEGDAGLSTREAVDGDHVVVRSKGHTVEVLEGMQADCSGLAAQADNQSCQGFRFPAQSRTKINVASASA